MVGIGNNYSKCISRCFLIEGSKSQSKLKTSQIAKNNLSNLRVEMPKISRNNYITCFLQMGDLFESLVGGFSDGL